MLTGDANPVSGMGIRHGSMVWVGDRRSAAASQCKHGPQFTCIHCASGEATGEMRCNHGEGATCLLCMDSGAGGESKCNHGPGTVCINCMGGKKGGGKDKGKKKKKKKKKKGKSAAPPPSSCRHPPSMRCPDCVSTSADEKGKGEAESAFSRCTHGPNMKCPNCVESSESDSEDEDGVVKCPFHGPNGRCTHCMRGTLGQMPVLKNEAVASIENVTVDSRAIEVFAPARNSSGFVAMRSGYMFGSVSDDGTAVKVDYIYEPRQGYSEDGWFEYDSEQEATEELALVQTIAQHLGRSLVGLVFTRPSDIPSSVVFLSNKGVALAANRAAALRNGATEGFLILTISVASNALQALAYEINPLAIRMAKKKYFAPLTSVAYAQDSERIPLTKPVVFQHAETNTAPSVFLYARIFAVTAHSAGLTGGFPVENRVGETISLDSVKTHLLVNQDQALHTVFADFHLLLFLASLPIFEVSDIFNMCDGVIATDNERLEGYALILQNAQ